MRTPGLVEIVVARQQTNRNGMFHRSDVPGNHHDTGHKGTTGSAGGGCLTLHIQGGVMVIGNSSRICLTKQDCINNYIDL